ncbi:MULTISPECIES: alpha/beta hydrolase [Actinomyces]|uniref:Alpha/beta hydrolase n=1 Tax=Actinomyces respiraculi TaxID=2744574 RepID=A0A7T0LN46_9ACTO|nr:MULTISPECIES: alpha/beta hydrolase [Actinomyces]QPL06198.1 alpha/beta hydrolase [Actinomyces respiraculi]
MSETTGLQQLTERPDARQLSEQPGLRQRGPRRRPLLGRSALALSAFIALTTLAELIEIPGLSYSLMLGTWGLGILVGLCLLTLLSLAVALHSYRADQAGRARMTPGTRLRVATAALLVLATAVTGGIGTAQLSYVTAQGTDVDILALTGIGQAGSAPDLEPVVLNDTETGQLLRAGIWYPRDVDGQRLTAQEVRAAHPDGVPVIVLIHGGGWSNGNRLNPMTRGQADWFARQGYLAVALDYPLSTTDQPTWQLAESRTACGLAWVGAHATEHGGDARRLALVGDSAGGHLALNLTYRQALGTLPTYPTDCGGQVPDIGAVLTEYPIADPVGFHDNPDLVMGPFVSERAERYTGGAPAEVPERYEAIDPVRLLRQVADAGQAAGLPPTLIVAGERDHVVPVGGARALDALLSEVGTEHETHIVPFTDHVFDLNPGSAVSQMWRDRALAILKETGLGV